MDFSVKMANVLTTKAQQRVCGHHSTVWMAEQCLEIYLVICQVWARR